MFWHSCFFLFAKKMKRATAVARESFFFKRKGVLFREEKYQKSFKRAFLPLKKHLPRARVSRRKVVRGKCVRHGAKHKSVVLPLSATSYYHACKHSTRKSRADSCTHCLHAR